MRSNRRRSKKSRPAKVQGAQEKEAGVKRAESQMEAEPPGAKAKEVGANKATLQKHSKACKKLYYFCPDVKMLSKSNTYSSEQNSDSKTQKADRIRMQKAAERSRNRDS